MKSRAWIPVLMIVIGLFWSCDSGPKVIESVSDTEESSADNNAAIPSLQEATGGNSSGTANSSEDHKVVAEEVLNTDRYTYINVNEEGENFWVAISKREIVVGDTYYFKGGLMKKNFFSQEFDRVFETLYLVSQFWKQPSSDESALDEAFAELRAGEGHPNLDVEDIEPAAGAVTLKELYKNKDKYENQLVKVTGKCVKVNPMIMKRNWIHIQDGSEEGLDLTVTTTENIPLGAVVTVEGTIALNKDFGAGYRYDIIMESAVVQ